ncbi:MAG: T9SS type A sorting domain-containing protein, partial [Bacteroidota bacterium]
FEISSNIWYNFGDATDATNLVRVDDGDDASAIATKLLGAGNTIEDPMISGVSRTPNGMLDPRPTVGSPAYQNIADVPAEDDFFQPTGYRGAFSFGNNWATGWTHMDERGYFGDLVADKPTKNIQDVDLVAGQTYNWSADTIYVLDGYVFLEQGGVLNIAAGTVVQGGATPSDANDLTSALVITRGAKINAIGTAEEPIIFTAEGEDGNFTIPDDRGSWGGLIILGNATVGEENATGIANVEGIPQEDRTQYGGGMNPIDDEDSGTLRYLSIRYGGAVLADNNEINGLTLGGVGSGTDISYIEVYGNNDDGIEFFGGSVDVKYASVIFCKDDSFDSDQSWSGRGQFWFTLMLPNDQTGNNQNGGEHDGSENPADNGGPVQTVWNATYIGMGQDMDNGESNTGLRIKNGAAINYSNSIFTEFGKDGLRLQDNSYDRFLAGDFVLQNNIWWNFGDGNTPADFVRVDDGDDVAAVVNLLVNEQGNAVVDPALTQVNWTASADGGADGNGTDPRPSADSPVTENTATVPMDDFYSDVAFKGAFSNDATEPYWITWTHAFEQGVLVDLRTGVTDFERNDAGVMLAVPSPNPASVTTQLDISLPVASEVKLTIFDQMGRRVSDRVLGNLPAGDNVYNLDVQRLVNGHYFLLLETNRGAVAQRVVINR